MVDYELRESLVMNLKRLLAGQTGSVDDAFYFRFTSTDDRGVREIATLCYSLFSKRPTSQPADSSLVKSQTMHRLLAKAILFLESELEYEWPAESLLPGRRAVFGLVFFLALPIVMAMVAFSVPVNVVAAQSFTLVLVLFSSAGMLFSLYLIAMKPAPVPIKSKKLGQRGDYEVWPFYRRGDYALSNRQR